MLFVIEAGKAIRRALRDVSGDRAVVQRCQVHKARNLLNHLPAARLAYVTRRIRDGYDSATAATAKRNLNQFASWLDSNGHTDAAARLRESLDETLHVMRLGLTGTLRPTFATTHPDREHEWLVPARRVQRQALEGRSDDATMTSEKEEGRIRIPTSHRTSRQRVA
jgi:hypothetical protein